MNILLWKESDVRHSLWLLLLPLLITACPPADSGNTPVCVPADASVAGLAVEGDPVVATYDGQEIKLSELDDEAKPQIIKALMNIDQARQRTLDDVLFNSLAEAEATAVGMEVDAWVKQEVDDKVSEVTDEEARAFFDENPPRGGRGDFEQMKDRVKQYMMRSRSSERKTELFTELKTKHGVKIMLEPFRIEVSADDDPFKGPADAPVTIIEFADFQCGFCGRARDTTSALMEMYPTQVKLVFRDYPIPKHPRAARMSEAANCASDQDKYWEFFDTLFDNPRKTTDDDMKAHAEALGLDTEAFNTCLDSNKYADEVQKDFEDGAAAGVSGTPAFFINGRMIAGAQPPEAFAAIIDDELTRAGVPVPTATEPAAE